MQHTRLMNPGHDRLPVGTTQTGIWKSDMTELASWCSSIVVETKGEVYPEACLLVCVLHIRNVVIKSQPALTTEA